nr:AAA family ATPase [Actinoalloteichus spitiensis]
MLYGRLDALRYEASDKHATVLRENDPENPQERWERDVSAGMYAERLSRFREVEDGLCFGRLDLDTGERNYIGRLGLFDEGNEYAPLLMDWRAPAARPFYTATAASPEGVLMRRHIRTVARTVKAVDDEVLDVTAARGDRPSSSLTAEATLFAALDESRTGRMKDIVATIQQEQDRIIRSSRNGVLVVQGGPGTGKTAVALHRTAYLLYTYRDQLAKRGTLVVGPNPTFLRYIEQVLPSLGETGVLLSTVAKLYPGVSATRRESVAAAEIKGRAEMAKVVAKAIKDRQLVPRQPVELTVEMEPVVLDKAIVTQARTRARRSRRPHNEAKEIFVREVIAALARQMADRLGSHLLERGDLTDIRSELEEDTELRKTLDELWPNLTPQRLLSDLFSSPERLRRAAPKLSDEERALLLRPKAGGWTPADVPLLDEAAELLGKDDRAARKREAHQRRRELAYAQGVLEILELEEELDPELLRATDIVDARLLADRHEERRFETTAERAAADRTWTYGHIVVDEAQELSDMAWRMLMRRCPSKSMTLVGDVAQTGDPAGTSSWGAVLEPYVNDRWRLEQLTVNYRTPAEIMTVAAGVLAEIDPTLAAPSSVRETGTHPWSVRVPGAELAERAAALTAAQVEEVGDGLVAVLVPSALLEEVGDAVRALVPDAATGGGGPEALTSRVTVLTVGEAKGLEFDAVLVVEPAEIVAGSSRGPNDLYVALTRATQQLGVVHSADLPPSLGGLRPRD